MTPERAHEINRVLVDVALYSTGLNQDCPEAQDYSLEEMIAATRMIQLANQRNPNGGCVMCDDRMIAAIYVLWNFEPKRTPIAMDKKRAIGCIAVGDTTREAGEVGKCQ